MPDLSKLYKSLKQNTENYVTESEPEFITKWTGKETQLYDKLSNDIDGFSGMVPKDDFVKTSGPLSKVPDLSNTVGKTDTYQGFDLREFQIEGNKPAAKKDSPIKRGFSVSDNINKPVKPQKKVPMITSSEDPFEFGKRVTNYDNKIEQYDEGDEAWKQQGKYELGSEALNAGVESINHTIETLKKDLGPGVVDSFLKTYTLKKQAVTNNPNSKAAKDEFNNFLKQNEGLVNSWNFKEINSLTQKAKDIEAYDEALKAETPEYQKRLQEKNAIQSEVDLETDDPNAVIDPTMRYVGRTLGRLAKNVGSLTNSDKVLAYGTRLLEDNPTTTKNQRNMIESYATVDGQEYAVDRNGKALYGIAKNGNKLELLGEVVIPQGTEIKSRFNTEQGLSQLADVFGDYIVTGGISTLGGAAARGIGMIANAAKVADYGRKGTAIGGAIANGLQIQDQTVQRALDQGQSLDEALFNKVANGVMYAGASRINPMDSRAANAMLGQTSHEVSENLGRYLSGQISKTDLVKEAFKKVGKSALGENVEELLLEPTADELTAFTASKLTSGEYKNQFPDAKQLLETAIITTAFAAIGESPHVDYSKSKLLKKAVRTAIGDPDALNDIFESMKAVDYEKNKPLIDKFQGIISEVKESGLDQKGKETLGALLLQRGNAVMAKERLGDNPVTAYRHDETISQVDQKIRELFEREKSIKDQKVVTKEDVVTTLETITSDVNPDAQVTPAEQVVPEAVSVQPDKPVEEVRAEPDKVKSPEDINEIKIGGIEARRVEGGWEHNIDGEWIKVNGGLNEIYNDKAQEEFEKLSAESSNPPENVSTPAEPVEEVNPLDQVKRDKLDRKQIQTLADDIGKSLDNGTISIPEIEEALAEAKIKRGIFAGKYLMNTVGSKLPKAGKALLNNLVSGGKKEATMGAKELEKILDYHKKGLYTPQIKFNEKESKGESQKTTRQPTQGKTEKVLNEQVREVREISKTPKPVKENVKAKVSNGSTPKRVRPTKEQLVIGKRESKSEKEEFTLRTEGDGTQRLFDKEGKELSPAAQANVMSDMRVPAVKNSPEQKTKISKEVVTKKYSDPITEEEQAELIEAVGPIDKKSEKTEARLVESTPAETPEAESAEEVVVGRKTIEAFGKAAKREDKKKKELIPTYEFEEAKVYTLPSSTGQPIRYVHRGTYYQGRGKGRVKVHKFSREGSSFVSLYFENNPSASTVLTALKGSDSILFSRDPQSPAVQQLNDQAEQAALEAINAPKNTKSFRDKLVKLAKKLNKAFPGVEVVFDNKETARVLRADGKQIDESSIKYLRTTTNGTIYGFVFGGKIYIDLNVAGFETPIHEFGHIWNAYARTRFPELFKRGIDLVRDSIYHREVENNEAYDGLTKEGKLEEALALAIGRNGQEFLNNILENKFKKWFRELFEAIGRKLGILDPKVLKTLDDLDINEFASYVVKDFTSGEVLYSGGGSDLMSDLNEVEKVQFQARENFLSDKLDSYLSMLIGDKTTPDFDMILASPYYEELGIDRKEVEDRYEALKSQTPEEVTRKVFAMFQKAGEALEVNAEQELENARILLARDKSARGKDLTSANLSEKIKNSTGEEKTFYQVLEKLQKPLQNKGHRIIVNDSIDSYMNALEAEGLDPHEAFKSSGVYVNGRIHLFTGSPDFSATTALHEFIHPVLIEMMNKQPSLYKNFLAQLFYDKEFNERFWGKDEWKKYTDTPPETPEEMQRLFDTLDNEALTQFLAEETLVQMLTNLDSAPKTVKDKIIDFIKNLYNSVFKSDDLYNQKTVKDFANQLAKNLIRGREIPLYDAYNTSGIEASYSKNNTTGDPYFKKFEQIIIENPDNPPSYWEELLNTGLLAEKISQKARKDLVAIAKRVYKNRIRGSKRPSIQRMKLLESQTDDYAQVMKQNENIIEADYKSNKASIQELLKDNPDIISAYEKKSYTMEGLFTEVLRKDAHKLSNALEAAERFTYSNERLTHYEYLGMKLALQAGKRSLTEISKVVDREKLNPNSEASRSAANYARNLNEALTTISVALQTDVSQSAGKVGMNSKNLTDTVTKSERLSNILKIIKTDKTTPEKTVIELEALITEQEAAEAEFEAQAILEGKKVKNDTRKYADEVFNKLKESRKAKSAGYDEAKKAEADSELKRLVEIYKNKLGKSFSPGDIKMMAHGVVFNPDRVRNEDDDVLFQIGKILIEDPSLNIKNFEELTLEIQKFDPSVTTEDVRVAFALKAPEVKDKMIDVYQRQVKSFKEQGKLIQDLAELLEGSLMDKTTVEIQDGGNSLTFKRVEDTIVLNSPKSFNAVRNKAKWVTESVVNGQVVQTEATPSQLQKIKLKLDETGVNINDDVVTGGVDKYFVRMGDPNTKDLGFLSKVKWVTIDPTGNTVEATPEEVRLIKTRVKELGRLAKAPGAITTKSVQVDVNGVLTAFEVDQEGKWVKYVDGTDVDGNPVSRLEYADEWDIVRINAKLEELTPYVRLQSKLTEILKNSTNLETSINRSAYAQFIQLIREVQNEFPTSLAGFEIDEYKIRRMLAKVDNMKSLVGVDRVDALTLAVENKIKDLERGKVADVLRSETVEKSKYASKEMLAARERLSLAKRKLEAKLYKLKPHTLGEKVEKHWGLISSTIKAMMASVDVSFTLIQGAKGLINAVSIPLPKRLQTESIARWNKKAQAIRRGYAIAAGSYIPFKGIPKAEDLYEEIVNSEYYPQMMMGGLAITSPTERGLKAEELFRESYIDYLADKVAEFGSQSGSDFVSFLKRASEASYTTMANTMRASMFNDYMDANLAIGITPTDDEITAICRSINDITGRSSTIGDKDLSGHLNTAGLFVWAPKMYLGEMKFLAKTIIPVDLLRLGYYSLKTKVRDQGYSKFLDKVNEKEAEYLRTKAISDADPLNLDLRKTKEKAETAYNKAKSDLETIHKKLESSQEQVRINKFKSLLALKSWTSLAAITATYLGALKIICKDGAEIPTNYTKSDFLKPSCKGGYGRETLGNLSGYIRTALQFGDKVEGQIDKNHEPRGGGRFYDEKTPFDIAADWVVGKANPAISTPGRAIVNRDYFGDPIFDWTQPGNVPVASHILYVLKNIAPLSSQELMDQDTQGSIEETKEGFKTLARMGGIGMSVSGASRKDPYQPDVPNFMKSEILRKTGGMLSVTYSDGADPEKKSKKEIEKLEKLVKRKIATEDQINKLRELKIPGSKAINMDPISVEDMNLSIGMYDKMQGAKDEDKWVYNKLKKEITGEFREYITEKMDKGEGKWSSSEVENKLEEIKKGVEKRAKEEGFFWGYDKRVTDAKVEFLKSNVPEYKGVSKKGLLEGASFYPFTKAQTDKFESKVKEEMTKEGFKF